MPAVAELAGGSGFGGVAQYQRAAHAHTMEPGQKTDEEQQP